MNSRMGSATTQVGGAIVTGRDTPNAFRSNPTGTSVKMLASGRQRTNVDGRTAQYYDVTTPLNLSGSTDGQAFSSLLSYQLFTAYGFFRSDALFFSASSLLFRRWGTS